MNSFCRVCMVQNAAEFISLFQLHASEGDVIANMIIDCTEVMVSYDDNLPQNICKECLQRLTHAYKLRKQCQQSDQALRNMLLRGTKLPKSINEIPVSMDKLFLSSFNVQHIEILNSEQNYKVVQITGWQCCGCNSKFDNSDELKHHFQVSHAQAESRTQNMQDCAVCESESCINAEMIRQKGLSEYVFYVCTHCEQMLLNEHDLDKHLKNIHNIEILFTSKEKDLASDENLDLSVVKDESMEGQDVEYLDDDDDYHEYVDSTLNHKLPDTINDNSYEMERAPLPESEFVSTIEEFSKYNVYHINGERCCGCHRLFLDFETLLIHCDRDHKDLQDLNEVKHRCNTCFKTFENSSLLNKHKLAVKSKIMFLCKLCDVVFEDDIRFIKHIISAEKHDNIIEAIKNEDKFEEIYVKSLSYCGCDATNENENEELHHSSTVGDSGELKCNKCSKGFQKLKHFERLNLDALKRVSYRCRTEGCNFSTFQKRQILKHITTQYVHRNLSRKMIQSRKTTNVLCEEFSCCFARCREVFNSYEELENHAVSVHEILRIQHMQDRKFVQSICMICLKGFENEQAYERHRSIDKNQKHECLKCGSQYVSKSTLLQHERSKCGKVAQYQCTQCDKSFVSLGGLRNHQGVHSQIRSHICEICGRGFLRKGILKDHINTVHSTTRLFQCSLCPKSFTSRNVFKSHQMTHTKEKPYQCRHCEKRYYKTSDRTMHENQVHFGIRPFRCNYCSASFIRDRERRLHERTHTKAKLYSCDLCSEGFNKFSEYKSHRLKEHDLDTLRDLGPATMAAVGGEQNMPKKSRCKLEVEVLDNSIN